MLGKHWIIELSNILVQVRLDHVVIDDGFRWFSNCEGKYVVSEGAVLIEDSLKSCIFLWQMCVPSNILLFGWRCIKNRLATYEQLLIRGISHCGSRGMRVFCINSVESLNHFLVTCPFATLVWEKLLMWLGF